MYIIFTCNMNLYFGPVALHYIINKIYLSIEVKAIYNRHAVYLLLNCSTANHGFSQSWRFKRSFPYQKRHCERSFRNTGLFSR